MRKCSIEGCDNPLRSKTGKVNICPMHQTRLKRNDSIKLKKEITNTHGLEILPHDIVNDIIRDNMDKKDKEIMEILIENGFEEASLRNIKYRRKKLGLKKYNFDGKHYSKKEAKQTYGEKCELCSYDLTIDVHHIIEKKNGGTDDLDNLCILCPNCHALVHRGVLSNMNTRNDIPTLILELKKLTN